jgi:hypothetical protein
VNIIETVGKQRLERNGKHRVNENDEEIFLRRHCEPTGRANARPMTGSAKRSRAASKNWIASSLTLLAMTERLPYA